MYIVIAVGLILIIVLNLKTIKEWWLNMKAKREKRKADKNKTEEEKRIEKELEERKAKRDAFFNNLKAVYKLDYEKNGMDLDKTHVDPRFTVMIDVLLSVLFIGKTLSQIGTVEHKWRLLRKTMEK